MAFNKSKLEPDRIEYDGVYSPYRMRDWLLANVFGLVGHRTTNTASFFSPPFIVVYFDIDYDKNVKVTNYWRNRVLKVAHTFSADNVTFAMSDVQDFEQELLELGTTAVPSRPTVVGRDRHNGTFIMSEDFSVEGLEVFVRRLLSGSLTSDKRLEAEDRKSFVKVIVSKTFDEIVNDQTRDVLIVFYTAQSQQFKLLAPLYEELAFKLKDEDNLVLAKMDGTTEIVPEPYVIYSFPTIYLAPVGSKSEPKLYQGAYDVDSFMEFLQRESTLPQLSHSSRTSGGVKAEL